MKIFTVVCLTPYCVQQLAEPPSFKSMAEAEADAEKRNKNLEKRNKERHPADILPLHFVAVEKS